MILRNFSIIILLAFLFQPALSEPTREGFTLKVLKRTGENIFSNLAYECNECTFEQFDALTLPRGWRKSPKQIILPVGELLSHLSFEGVSSTLDLIPEIPGDEFQLIAKGLEGKIVNVSFSGIMIKSKVMRNTVLRYPAGRRVHELTDKDGNIYVLFAYEVKSVNFDRMFFEKDDVLLNYPRPKGWSYSSRIINEDLILNSKGIVDVLAIRSDPSSVWEKR
ncbi:MAG: hypothetical protein VX847_04930 [Pseudomonadota bacterium]|nr:hypothetical protein [Pseudomonadota bacterium]MED5436927.1 hypothetical protein [Pseudomonadota bacterium]